MHCRLNNLSSESSYLPSPTPSLSPSSSSNVTQSASKTAQPSISANGMEKRNNSLSMSEEETLPIPSSSLYSTAERVQLSKEHVSGARSDADSEFVVIDDDGDDEGYEKTVKLEGMKTHISRDEHKSQSPSQPLPLPLLKPRKNTQTQTHAHRAPLSPPPPIETLQSGEDTDKEPIPVLAFKKRSTLNGRNSSLRAKPALRFPSNSQTSVITKVGTTQKAQVIDLSLTPTPPPKGKGSIVGKRVHRYTFRKASEGKAGNTKGPNNLKRARELILDSTDEDEYVPPDFQRQRKKRNADGTSSSLFFGGRLVIPKGVKRAAFFELEDSEHEKK